MRLSTFSTEDAQVRGYAVALASRASHQTVGMRAFCLSIAIALTTGACVSSGGLLDKKAGPIGEAELAAKKLQEPLDKHLCKAAIYPVARPDWKISRVQSLQGRGPSFQAALEALCREADGQKFPALVDLYYERAVTAWSPNHALRGTAVRYSDGFEPPPPPEIASIKPPEMPKPTDEEPAPSGEPIPANPGTQASAK
jgi:hypothetical protein